MLGSFNDLLQYFSTANVVVDMEEIDDGSYQIFVSDDFIVTIDVDGVGTLVSGFITTEDQVQVYVAGNDYPYPLSRIEEVEWHVYKRLN